MKISKRLLAVLMAVVMILTIVPLGLFAFAGNGEGETPEPTEPPVQDGSAENPWIITTIDEFNQIGKKDSKYLSSHNYVLGNDIVGQTAEKKVVAWLADETNQQTAGDYLKYNLTYVLATGEFDATGATTYYTKNEENVYAEVTEPTAENFATYYVASCEKFTVDDFGDPITEDPAYGELLVLTKATGDELKPITDTFSGTFDGKDHTISGVHVTLPSNVYCGLFANNSGTIKNLTLDADVIFEVTSTTDWVVGGIVGINSGKILSCQFSGTLRVDFESYLNNTSNTLSDLYGRSFYVGGVVGFNGGTVEGCSLDKDAKITTNYAGGDSIVLKQLVGFGDFKAKESAVDEEIITNDAITLLDETTYLKTVKSYTDLPDGTVSVRADTTANGYQLVKITSTDLYYIRTKVCNHADATHTEAKAATCTAKGNIAYWYCGDCDKYFADGDKPTADSDSIAVTSIETTDPTNHVRELVKTEKEAATCTKAGIKYDYYTCPDCGNKYKDEAGTDKITKNNDWVENALGHDWDDGTVTKQPTYDETGVKTYHCTREGCSETKTETIAKLVPPTISPKSSSSGYAVKTLGGNRVIVAPNPPDKYGIDVATFKNALKNDGYTFVVKDASGKEVTSGPVGTGYTVEIKGTSSKALIVLRGDANGDGKLTYLDYIKVKNHRLGTNVISESSVNFIGADANGDGKISYLDYVRIKNIILNTK